MIAGRSRHLTAAENHGVLVVGIGTRYRKDDAAGLMVAESLRTQLPAGATLIEHEGEGVALMESLQGWRAAILIDAMNSGARRGTVHRFEAKTHALPAAIFRHSTHALSVADGIELGRALERLPQHLVVFGIEGSDFNAGVPLSPEVESSVPEVVRRVLEEIHTIQGEPR
jgi:hydrogenase maturation protease